MAMLINLGATPRAWSAPMADVQRELRRHGWSYDDGMGRWRKDDMTLRLGVEGYAILHAGRPPENLLDDFGDAWTRHGMQWKSMRLLSSEDSATIARLLADMDAEVLRQWIATGIPSTAMVDGERILAREDRVYLLDGGDPEEDAAYREAMIRLRRLVDVVSRHARAESRASLLCAVMDAVTPFLAVISAYALGAHMTTLGLLLLAAGFVLALGSALLKRFAAGSD